MTLRKRVLTVVWVVSCFVLAAVLVIGGSLMALNYAADGSVPAVKTIGG